MNIDLINLLIEEYDAQVLSTKECSGWLLPNQTLIVGLRLANPHKNYMLMSERDFCAFKNEELQRMHISQNSPFDNIMVIIYQENNIVYSKLLNGMASKLLDIINV